MNKGTKLIIAAICAFHLVAGSVSAQYQRMVPEPAPVAGYSPNFAAPQPITGVPLATLTTDANRLVRWQGWLDIDAFSTSVLNQMQLQLEDGVIEAGTFTMAEPAIDAAVNKAVNCNKAFTMNENLRSEGESFCGDMTLYCWLYRHNYVDTGLYQLYISVKGKMLIGEQPEIDTTRQPHRDIQSLGYEFGPDTMAVNYIMRPVCADIEIWRGAVVRLDPTGRITFVGNEAGAVTPVGIDEPPPTTIAGMERAPSLINNPHYNPKRATGPAFVEPLDRTVKINKNNEQLKAGSTQKERRVTTVPVFKYRAR